MLKKNREKKRGGGGHILKKKRKKKGEQHRVLSTSTCAMNKPYNIQNRNICNGIFHISFFKALLINQGETTRGKTTRGANGIRGETTRYPLFHTKVKIRNSKMSKQKDN